MITLFNEPNTVTYDNAKSITIIFKDFDSGCYEQIKLDDNDYKTLSKKNVKITEDYLSIADDDNIVIYNMLNIAKIMISLT